MLKEKIMISSLIFMLFACGEKDEDTSVEQEEVVDETTEEVEEEDTATEEPEEGTEESEGEDPEDTSQEE
jgi:hypothetical protein